MTNGLSSKVVAVRWRRLKATLEYLHLAEWLLHPERSDLAALIVFVLSTQRGWLLLGSLAALHLFVGVVRHGVSTTDKQAHARIRKSTQSAQPLDMLGASLPNNVIELLREGITVKVSIELTPPHP